MKKLLLLVFPVLLISCSASGRDSRNNPIASLFKSEESTSFAQTDSLTSEEPFTSSNDEPISSNDVNYPIYDVIDIDLTKMNATLVYSQVSSMVNEPSAYIGKIVKMSGPFVPYESTDPNLCYPAILIKDATACCGSGIEFLLYGVPRCNMSGGNGYPLYNEEATVVGRFETYLEDSYLYIHLVDAIWLKDNLQEV